MLRYLVGTLSQRRARTTRLLVDESLDVRGKRDETTDSSAPEDLKTGRVELDRQVISGRKFPGSYRETFDMLANRR